MARAGCSRQRGDIFSGVSSGFLSSLGAAGFGAVVGDFSGKAAGQILFGMLSGGIGSELTGGNFWQGVVIGGVVAGLNHAMHMDDIVIRNRKGKELGRIVTDKVEKNVYLDTDVETSVPLSIKLSSYMDAVGFNFEISDTFGGGLHGGVSFVYFNGGKDAGSAYLYRYGGATMGVEMSLGGGIFYSKYVDSNRANFSALGYAGKSSGIAGGYMVYGGSYSWGNRSNVYELYPGMKSTTTWKTFSAGISKGVTGGKMSWANSHIWKKIF